MCSLNASEGEACGGHEAHLGSAHFPKVFDGTFNAPVDVTPLLGSKCSLFLLLFKTLSLLRARFRLASTNLAF